MLIFKTDSEVVKKTWLEPLLYENKLAVLDDALAALVHGRPLEQAVDLFLLVLKERFHLIQGAYLAIEKYAKIWRKRQMSKSGLET
jgi:hypothetical protein